MTAIASMSILVVEDFNSMVRIIRDLLKQVGFENVDEAADGAAALAKMRQKKYQLIISDWNMAPMTGYEFLRRVRADGTLAHTPFVMVTAEASVQLVIDAKRAGVNGFLVKPFNAQTLKRKIDEAMMQRGLAKD